MDPDMPVRVSAPSLLFLLVLHLRRLSEVLVQGILDVQVRLLSQITVSYFLVVDPLVKRTVTNLISLHDQVAR